jgi:hypothetical protein
VEVTFSSNYILDNIIKECRYGIWGGYSFDSYLAGNEIVDCQFGVAIEHGNHNQILKNTFDQCQTGVKLWDREQQPQDWGFALHNDVQSRNYLIASNKFDDCATPFDIAIKNEVTYFENMIDGEIQQNRSMDSLPENDLVLPSVLADGKQVFNINPQLDGRKFMIINEFGPYNFEYPIIWLREIVDNKYVFALFGPEGNWQIKSSQGFERGSLSSGTFPNTLICVAATNEPGNLQVRLEFLGTEFLDQFGQINNRGMPYEFSYTSNVTELTSPENI